MIRFIKSTKYLYTACSRPGVFSQKFSNRGTDPKRIPEDCPPLTQIDDCPPSSQKPCPPPCETEPVVTTAENPKQPVSPSSGVDNGQRSKTTSTHGAESGGNGQGSKRSWIYGGIALALGSALAYYTFVSGDDSSKAIVEKKKTKRLKRLLLTSVKSPPTSDDLPKQVQYLLIGGGAASFSAFRSIKSLDPKAEVLMISAEHQYPYMRPPLSKDMWKSDAQMRENMMFRQWNGSVRSVYFEPESFFLEPKALKNSSKGGISVARGWSVTKIDTVNNQVTLDDGSVITYGKCLLAPGSSPKSFPLIENAGPEVQEKACYFRDIEDFRDLHSVTEQAKNIVVIGGGFLGCELACSLVNKGCTVTQIFREEGLLPKVLPKYLSKELVKQIQKEGVNVLPESEVVEVKANDKSLLFTLSNGQKVEADFCVVATGAVPNTSLAESSKLEIDPKLGGYTVNPELLARNNLYIAGDAACFYDERWGRRRVEHHDHAVVSGRLAGENMAGGGKPYNYVSMLWTDISPDIGFEAVGLIDPKLPTFGVFALPTPEQPTDIPVSSEGGQSGDENRSPKEQFNKGVVFYHEDNVIVGVLLWNVYSRMQIARQLINEGKKYEDLNEVAKLFQIHEE